MIIVNHFHPLRLELGYTLCDLQKCIFELCSLEDLERWDTGQDNTPSWVADVMRYMVGERGLKTI